MNPGTYRRLLDLNNSIDSNRSFFMLNLMFTAADYNSVRGNLREAVQILQTNCRSGALKLDLDIEKYLKHGVMSTGLCE